MKLKDVIIAAVTIFSIGGGITIFNLVLPASHIQSSEEKTEDQDNRLFEEALHESANTYTSSSDYITSIKKLMGISKEYVKKAEVAELYNHCISGYIASTITESNQLLDEGKYDAASDLIVKAKKLISSIENYEINIVDLDQHLDYISTLKEINNAYELDDYVKAIKLTEGMGSDKRINDILVKARDQFEEKTIASVNKYLSNNDIKRAQATLNKGFEVVASSEKFQNKQVEIQNKEKKQNIQIYKEEIGVLKKTKDWESVINYINELPFEIQIEFKYDIDMAKNNLSKSIIDKVSKYMKEKDYANALEIIKKGESYKIEDQEYSKKYKLLIDYNNEKLKFKKMVNESHELEFIKDVNSNEFTALAHTFKKSGDALEFVVMNTSYVTGDLFLCYNGRNFNESVVVKIVFKDSQGAILKTYDNLTFKNSISFNVPTNGSEFITMHVEWNTSGSLALAIR